MTFATILVAVGSQFETRLLPYIDPDFSPYILLLWGMIRWIIATLTSIAVIALIYHNARAAHAALAQRDSRARFSRPSCGSR